MRTRALRGVNTHDMHPFPDGRQGDVALFSIVFASIREDETAWLQSKSVASAKSKPCLARLASRFASSHSYSTDIIVVTIIRVGKGTVRQWRFGEAAQILSAPPRPGLNGCMRAAPPRADPAGIRTSGGYL